MNKQANKDKKIKTYKKMLNELESSLNEEVDDIHKYKSQNPYLIDVAKKCIDTQAINKKNNLIKIEILEQIYNNLSQLENQKLTKDKKNQIKNDKKNLNIILSNIYDEI